MIGAIIGDVIGSIYEFENIKSEDFDLFSPDCSYTDDSVLTVATARAILDKSPYEVQYRAFGQKYQTPVGNYGHGFRKWLYSDSMAPYNSCGNGSAMRVSPVGFAFNTLDEVLSEAKRSAEVTHNHPEGIKGAQAVALAIFLARYGRSQYDIKVEIMDRFGYDLNRTCDGIRPDYHFGAFEGTCQGSVPEAIIAFLESSSYEDAVRKAVSLGGDSDTIACITGGIAQAYYKVIPQWIIDKGLKTVPEDLMKTINEFIDKFMRA